MGSPVKRIQPYVSKGNCRRQANKALLDSGDEDVEQSPWQHSKKRGMEKAVAAVGEDELQTMVSQFKQAESKQVADGVLKAALALRKVSAHQFRCAFGVGSQRLKRVRDSEPQLQLLGKQYSDSNLLFLRQFVKDIKTETGFACAHKWQREYLLQGTFTDL